MLKRELQWLEARVKLKVKDGQMSNNNNNNNNNNDEAAWEQVISRLWSAQEEKGQGCHVQTIMDMLRQESDAPLLPILLGPDEIQWVERHHPRLLLLSPYQDNEKGEGEGEESPWQERELKLVRAAPALQQSHAWYTLKWSVKAWSWNANVDRTMEKDWEEEEEGDEEKESPFSREY